MKEKPILFNADMVKAVISGRKTQTRRAWKMPKGFYWDKDGYDGGDLYESGGREHFPMHVDEFYCPYGKIGDQLWVRETHGFTGHGEIVYRADGEEPIGGDGFHETKMKWKPSIFMFRKYSRIQLEITNIRVERLNDITEDDARAEGVFFAPDKEFKNSFIQGFKNIWDSINGKKCPWRSNPWVWVVEFKVIS